MLRDGAMLNGIVKEDLAEKVPCDQVQGLWCVKAGEVVTKQTRGRESVGDRAAEPRAGKGVRSCSVLKLKCERPLT